jgi:hypothetical protein
MGYLSPYENILGYYLKIGKRLFHRLQIHHSHSQLLSYAFEKAVSNKLRDKRVDILVHVKFNG